MKFCRGTYTMPREVDRLKDHDDFGINRIR